MGSIAVKVALDLAALEGVKPERLLAGTGISMREVRNPFFRVPWGTYAGILQRVEDALGSEERLIQAAQQMPATLPELTALARAFVTPTALARFLFLVADPWVWPMIEFGVEVSGEDRLRIMGNLMRGFSPCRPYFVGSVGAAIGFPGYLGLPPATVEHVEVSDRHIDVSLLLPAPRTVVARAKAAKRRLEEVLPFVATGFDPNATLGPATSAPERRTLEMLRRLQVARTEWALTPRQVDVLRELISGKDNQEIAETLGCALKTVEAHVSAILERADAPSRLAVVAAFWSDLG